MVLGCRTQHGRTANVDVLDALDQAAIGLCGDRLEGVQVDHQQVDGADAVFKHHFVIGATAAEQAGMHDRMQGLDAAVHDLGKAGQGTDFGNRQTRLTQALRGSAGGNEVDAEGIESAREILQSGLVGNAEQGSTNGNQGAFKHCSSR